MSSEAVRTSALTVLQMHVLDAPMEGTSARQCTCGVVVIRRYLTFEQHLVDELTKAGVLAQTESKSPFNSAQEANIEAALRAAESGKAGHWMTVAQILADALLTMREQKPPPEYPEVSGAGVPYPSPVQDRPEVQS